MSKKIFKINNKGILEVVQSEVLLTKEFEALYNNLSSNVKFKSVWRYIFEIADVDSQPNKKGFNDEEAHDHAIDSSGLPKDWTPDVFVLDAIRRYEDEDYDSITAVRNELLATFELYPHTLRKIRIDLKTKIDADDVDLDKIIPLLDKVNGIAIKYPKLINDLLESLLLLNKGDKKDIGRGGIKVTDSMKE